MRPANERLHIAAAAGNTIEVWAALQAGASKDMTEPVHGWTPLQAACNSGRLGAVAMLLDAGAVVAPADGHGWTALMLAVRWGHMGIAGMLLEAAETAAAKTALLAATNADSESLAEIAEEYDQLTLWAAVATQLGAAQPVAQPAGPAGLQLVPQAQAPAARSVGLAAMAVVDDDAEGDSWT